MIVKQPGEQYNVAIDWTAALPPGAILQSGTVTATDQAGGGNASGFVLTTTQATILGVRSQATVTGGLSGHIYDLKHRVTLTTGEVLEENVQMLVQAL